LFRQEETYICPTEPFWEERYYQRLFENVDVDKVCVNYLEGLEWVLTYYMEGCVDWKWKYNFNYPPLVKDLLKHVLKTPNTFFHEKNTKPFKSSTQLIYVLPPNLHKTVLPLTTLNTIQAKYSHYFLPCETQKDLETWEFQWAFCRFFWECHIKTPEIPVEILEEWDDDDI
jgi:5'-3' exonuclease